MTGAATIGLSAWPGGGAASATTRFRSGAVHAQLASHASGNANALAPGMPLRGSGIMALLVAVLAICSLTFLVVTFVRRRITTT